MAVEKKTRLQEANNSLGLLFTGGDGPLPQFITNIMQEAYTVNCGEPVIAAADSGLLLAESGGLNPAWIIGDMDSLGTEAARLDAYSPEKILRYPSDKDFTDTELAFSLLREKGCNAIWIIGGGGGRLDQLFGIRSLFERNDPPLRWITAVDDIYCIDGSDRQIPCVLQKEYNGIHLPVFPLSIFPLGTGPWEAESAGLKWSLAGLNWKRDFIAISNEADEGSFTINAKQGRFMVMLPVAVQQTACFV